MKLAVMQPYTFPYIGYFQLVNAVDKFIFYDDVNYIKGGWINRNNILINNKTNLFTIPIIKPSSYKMIKDTELRSYVEWRDKFNTTLKYNYKKAPYYSETIKIINDITNGKHTSISEVAINSVKVISDKLKLDTIFEESSKQYPETKKLEKADRLIKISKLNTAHQYINPSGGKDLYDKQYFKKHGIELSFIRNEITPYKQFNNDFIGGLSIIDVMMFNSIEEIKVMLNNYILE